MARGQGCLLLNRGQGASDPSNVPTKFHWNNQNRFGEKCKNVISETKNDCHFPRSRSLEVKFADKVLLTLAMSLPSFVGLTKIDLEKSVKM